MVNHRADEERMKAIDRVGRDAKRWWNGMKPEFKTDKTFILRALQNSPTLPPKSDFERQFPQSLRFDRDVVLAFCRRSDFAELFEERHLYVPGCLSNDKEVMMAYCSKVPRSLQEASEELIDDPEVVEAAISLGGLELQYASLRLQEDPTIVQRACASHGRALEFCPPGPTRKMLTSDRNFMKDVVLSKPGGGTMWKLMDSELQNDPEVLLPALRNGLSLRDIPPFFKNDSSFLQRAIQSNSSLYSQLSAELQSCEALAREAIIAGDSTPEIHEKALGHCPLLNRERLVVLSLCERGNVDHLEQLLRLPSSHPFLDDLEIMKAAISRSSSLLSLASPRLKHEPEVILISITPSSAWNTLKTVSSNVLREHPEIPTRAVELCCKANLRYLPANIPDALWTSYRPLPLAWIRRGGRVLNAFESILVPQPPYTEENLQLPLELVKHNYAEAYKLGEALLGNRDFMEKALFRDGRVLSLAPQKFRQNFDLQVLAIANHNINVDRDNQATASNIRNTFGSFMDVDQLKEKIRTKLDLHETFVKDFLRGIAIVTPRQPPSLRSQLPMLDRGVETSQAFKRLIAEYLGVPLGTELGLLRQAMEILEAAPTAPHAAPRNNDMNEDNAFFDAPQMLPENAQGWLGHPEIFGPALHDHFPPLGRGDGEPPIRRPARGAVLMAFRGEGALEELRQGRAHARRQERLARMRQHMMEHRQQAMLEQQHMRRRRMMMRQHEHPIEVIDLVDDDDDLDEEMNDFLLGED